MHSVTVRICAPEFSATMTAIREWLDGNRYKPTRYKYDHDEDAALVTVNFPAGVAAKAFAARFGGVDRFLLQPTSPDSLAPVDGRSYRLSINVSVDTC